MQFSDHLSGILLSAIVAVTVGLAVWARRLLWRDPSRWLANPGFERQVGLVKRFLRREGWTLGEPLPWINVFVRAQRNGIWLCLVVHTKDGMGLATLIKDCSDFALTHNVIIGIVSNDPVPPECATDAERIGLFVIKPTELSDAEARVRQIGARLATERQKAETERAATRLAVDTAT